MDTFEVSTRNTTPTKSELILEEGEKLYEDEEEEESCEKIHKLRKQNNGDAEIIACQEHELPQLPSRNISELQPQLPSTLMEEEQQQPILLPLNSQIDPDLLQKYS